MLVIVYQGTGGSVEGILKTMGFPKALVSVIEFSCVVIHLVNLMGFRLGGKQTPSHLD